jgi:hypothetical protein
MHRLKLIISKLGVGGEAINRVCTGDGGDEGDEGDEEDEKATSLPYSLLPN